MPAELQLQFQDEARQRHAAKLAMWVFLSTEVMFFAALFAAYAMYQSYYPEAFSAGSHHLARWAGTAETADLLTSSLFVALALHAVKIGRRGAASMWLALAALAGIAFLVLHGHEYLEDFREGALPGRLYHLDAIAQPGAPIFFGVYFFMTGLHSIHVLVGVGVLLTMLRGTARGRYGPAYSAPVENAGLYWHFVDLVWVFLYPMFYLVR
jgi:cytochrome c oxidase subunit 3